MEKEHLNKFWWLALPLIFMVFQGWLELSLPSRTLSILHSENGPHETLQAILMFLGLCVALGTLITMDKKKNPWLTGWIALAALCCLYVGGEEISWGQHILEWHTPEFWSGINDQNETNLHNTSSWLDQKPRLLLLIGVVGGGLGIPLLQRLRPALLPRKLTVIYPPAHLAVIAGIAGFLEITSKIDGVLKDIVIFERGSEVEELYLFYFVLLYLIALRRRVAQDKG